MTTGSVQLSETFAHVAAKMRADFELSRQLNHRGSKGSSREEILRKFLVDFLPRVAEVTGNAELISTDGQISGQCDVLVVDASTPSLWSADSVRTVPIESCHGWVEVKSQLSVAELTTAWKAAVKIKRMPRTAYQTNLVSSLLGASTNGLAEQLHRDMTPQCHVFAYSGASLETLQTAMGKLAADTDIGMGLDSVCVLDQGFLTWVTLEPDDVRFGKEFPGSALATYAADPGQVLLFLNAFLHAKLSQIELYPLLDFNQYVREGIGTRVGDLVAPQRSGVPTSPSAPGAAHGEDAS